MAALLFDTLPSQYQKKGLKKQYQKYLTKETKGAIIEVPKETKVSFNTNRKEI